MYYDFDTVYFNKNFRLTWQPNREKIKPYLIKKARATITVEKLFEIVGEKRGNFIAGKCLEMKEQNKRFKVQNKGILDVYST